MDNQSTARFAMTPEAFTAAVYKACLGRDPDPEGWKNCANLIRSTGDPTLVLQAILASPEFLSRSHEANVDCTDIIAQTVSFLTRRLRVVDVGAQSLGVGSHPYDALLGICDVEIIGFDPLVDRLRERAAAEPSSNLTLLPYAVGDGGTYTWYVNNVDSTSSLFPLNVAENKSFAGLAALHTVRFEQIKTHRLDDVLPDGPVDMLKLDVQGAELLVLKGSEQILPNTAAIHCEVSFSSMYLGQALFPEIFDFLSDRGFVLIDLFLPGRYNYVTASGSAAKDRLIWGDAIFFRETQDSEVQRIQALFAASVYRKPSLAEYLLQQASQLPVESPCPPVFQFRTFHLNPRLNSPLGAVEGPGMERMRMTVSCRDADFIPKVPGAGEIVDGPAGTLCQLMHNGIYVIAGGYHGDWMSEVIRRLRGHHEPQEEALFHAVLQSLGSPASNLLMVELGAFWSYYSLWFRSAYPQGRNILVEPDEENMRVGQKNFALNGFEGEFLQAAVGDHNGVLEFLPESDGIVRPIKTVSIDGMIRDMNLNRIDLLHADIQGAELSLLRGMTESIASGRINWLFLSTHHHAISGDPLTHQKCLQFLTAENASIIAEHSVSESFSGDGLIVARFGGKPDFDVPRITRNVPSNSLFRETEFDLAEAWDEIRRLRSLTGQS